MISEVVVVGAGPIGLAAAISLAKQGLVVRVFEARQPPLDKPCGEGLMPAGVGRLLALGVDLPGVELQGIRYRAPGLLAQAHFPAARGRGVRRLALHQAMVDRAAALSIAIEWGERVDEVNPTGSVTTASGRTIKADLVVVADGARSKLRAQLGLAGRGRSRERFGVRAHYACAPWTNLVEVHFHPEAEAYVTPVADHEVGVALLTSQRPPRFKELLRCFPELGDRLSGSTQTSQPTGTGPLEQRARGRRQGRVVLVGDAAGYLDAITGEGLTLGLEEVALLTDVVLGGDLEGYDPRIAKLISQADRLARLWLLTDQRPRLRARALRCLSRDPGLLASLLTAHVGGGNPKITDVLRLGFGLACA